MFNRKVILACGVVAIVTGVVSAMHGFGRPWLSVSPWPTVTLFCVLVGLIGFALSAKHKLGLRLAAIAVGLSAYAASIAPILTFTHLLG